MKPILKNFSLTILSSLISLVTSALIVFILPKLIGVRDYGFWQWYNLLATYVGVVPLGWIDGMYLKLGGMLYSKLDKSTIHRKFVLFTYYIGLVSFLVILTGFLFVSGEYKIVVIFIGLTIFAFDVRGFISYVLQATNRIAENAAITMMSSVLYLIFVAVLIFLKVYSVPWFIVANVLSMLISMVYAVYSLRDIVFFKQGASKAPAQNVVNDIFDDVRVGMKLLLANFSAMLFMGIVRIGIERAWNIETFGKISLVINFSNLLMVFIMAISMTVFPLLRRLPEESQKSMYSSLRVSLMFVLFAMLFAYIPIQIIIKSWLPNYAEDLYYLPIMLTTVVLQGKFELLSNTFLKVFRMESELLATNVIASFINVVLTFIMAFIVHNLTYLLVSLMIVMLIRSLISEIFLSQRMNINVIRDQLLEVIVFVSYVLLMFRYSLLLGGILYAGILIVFAFFERKSLRQAFDFFRNQFSSTKPERK